MQIHVHDWATKCCRSHIYPGKAGFCFFYFRAVLCVQKSRTIWPYDRIPLFAHYTTSLSSLCRRIWKYRTSKMMVMYILSSVCLRFSQFSRLEWTYFSRCWCKYPKEKNCPLGNISPCWQPRVTWSRPWKSMTESINSTSNCQNVFYMKLFSQ